MECIDLKKIKDDNSNEKEQFDFTYQIKLPSEEEGDSAQTLSATIKIPRQKAERLIAYLNSGLSTDEVLIIFE